MLAALSATNEAIMRAKSREELYDLVCQASATGGKFTSATIALASPGSEFLSIVAAAGPSGDARRNVRLSISDKYPEGRGMSGTAFRTRQPCISNDYLNDERVSHFPFDGCQRWREVGRGIPAAGARSGRRCHDLHVD